ncbi:MAG: glycosyltransferase family 4 protein [Sedimenticola sp.]
MILILTQCFPPILGGIETLMGGLADALNSCKKEVIVFADKHGDSQSHDMTQEYKIFRFGGWKPVRRLRKGLTVKSYVKRHAHQISHIIADSWKSLEHLHLSTPQRGGLRIVCLAHGMELPPTPHSTKKNRIRASFGKADIVLANSQMTRSLAESYIGKSTDLRIVTPPIHPQPKADDTAYAILDNRLGLMQDVTLLVSLGRLEQRKGIDRVIESINRLSSSHPKLILAIAGDGADRSRLETLVNNRPIKNRVHFLGRITEEEKAALLSRADAFVMPTRRTGNSVEGYGIVYIEAGWYGTPSLASRNSGAADAVIEGKTGMLCDGDDIDSITSELSIMISNPKILQQMGKNAMIHSHNQVWSRRVHDYL